MATFNSVTSATRRLRAICEELDLTPRQCSILEDRVGIVCQVLGTGKDAKKRKRSLWQECISVRMKGKPFDPGKIKDLSKEYRAGKCPP